MPTVAVVGAGVTGSAMARELARRGLDVTLVEQYGPGTVRSASGGDTRLIRAAHGHEEWYARSALRALERWRELEAETGTPLFEPVGLAWFARSADGFEARSRPVLERLGVAHEWLTPDDARRLFPSLDPNGLDAVLWEPGAGVLYARAATQPLATSAVRRGVRLETTRAEPARPPAADVVVWACGAWLPSLFPGLVAVEVSRRDVFFLGGDASWSGAPGFVEYDAGFYGHGDIGGLGVKVAPTSPRRSSSPTRSNGSRCPRSWRMRAATRPPASPRSPTRPCSAHGSASTTSPPTRTSSSTAIRSTRAGGSSAAARATGSSTARRSRSTSRTASRDVASRSASTRSARGPATQASEPARASCSRSPRRRASACAAAGSAPAARSSSARRRRTPPCAPAR